MRITRGGFFVLLGVALLALVLTPAGSAKTTPVKADPYVGAIVVDVSTGKVIYENGADNQAYPASIVKLMDLLIIIEKVEQGALKLTDRVPVTAESSKIGGSQVYLKEGESFTIDEMLYALMVQSANDCATALALHVAGSKQGFVELMNKRAKELGMTSTVFQSVHGLPPSSGQRPDCTTPRDLSLLAIELLKHKDTLRYTSTIKRTFREGTKNPMIMENHNHLLGVFQGCDGLKTGYFTLAGYSIAATAERSGRRVIAVVMGSTTRGIRDESTKALLSKGFLNLPALPPPTPVATNSIPTNAAAIEKTKSSPGEPWNWKKIGIIAIISLLVIGLISSLVARRSNSLDFK